MSVSHMALDNETIPGLSLTSKIKDPVFSRIHPILNLSLDLSQVPTIFLQSMWLAPLCIWKLSNFRNFQSIQHTVAGVIFIKHRSYFFWITPDFLNLKVQLNVLPLNLHLVCYSMTQVKFLRVVSLKRLLTVED